VKMCTKLSDMFAELQFSPYIILLETINLDCPYFEHEKK